MGARYQIQVTGEWGGAVLNGWRPAITGTLNQTGEDDGSASTFDTHDEAAWVLDRVVLPELTSDPYDGDPRDNAPRFRITEVESSDAES
jgi:hypothetical protein